MNALLIEDCPVTIRLLQSLIEGSGLGCVIARTAAEAMSICDAGQDVSLVITDLQLPDSSGFDLLGKIRTQPLYREVPVVIVTARSDKETVVKAASLGVQGFFQKPIAGRSFVRRLQEILSAEPMILSNKRQVVADMDIQTEVYDSMLTSFTEQLQHAIAFLEMTGAASLTESREFRVLFLALHESAHILGAQRLQKALVKFRLDDPSFPVPVSEIPVLMHALIQLRNVLAPQEASSEKPEEAPQPSDPSDSNAASLTSGGG